MIENEKLNQDISAQVALNISHITRARSLRSLRHSAFIKSNLSYGQTILGINDLVEKNIIKRSKKSKYKFINTEAKRHRNFSEFIASLNSSACLTEEIRAELKNIGIGAKGSYYFLRELIDNLLFCEVGKVKELCFKDTDFEGLSLKNFPIFTRNFVKESFFKRVSKIEFDEENMPLADQYSDLRDCSLYLGYPYYYSQKKELIPVFFLPVSLSKEYLNIYSLWAYNDFIFLNEKFIKTLIKEGQEQKLKSYLKLFINCENLDLSSLDNIEINLKEFSLYDLLYYLKLSFSFDFDEDFNLDHLIDKLDLNCENSFLNSAFIFKFSVNSAYPNFLNKILISDDEVLDKTALSCFSNTFVTQDKSIDPYCDENAIVGEDLSKIAFDEGAKRAVLYSAIDSSNNLCIVKDDLSLSELINAILLNYCFADGLFAFSKSSELLEKCQNAPKDNLKKQINENCDKSFLDGLINFFKTDLLKKDSKLNQFKTLSNLDLEKNFERLKRFLSLVNKTNNLSNFISFSLSKLSLDKRLKNFIFDKKNLDKSSYVKRAYLIYSYIFLEKSQRYLKHLINSDLQQEDESSNLKSFVEKGFSEKYTKKALNLSSFKAGVYKKSLLYLDKDFSLPQLLSLMFMSQKVTFIVKESDFLTKSEGEIPNCFELVNKLCIDDECGIKKNDLSLAKKSEDFSNPSSLSYLAKALINCGAQATFDDLGIVSLEDGEKKIFITCNYSFDEESQPQNEFEFALKEFLALSNSRILMVNKCAAEFDLEQYAKDIYSELKGGDFK